MEDAQKLVGDRNRGGQVACPCLSLEQQAVCWVDERCGAVGGVVMLGGDPLL